MIRLMNPSKKNWTLISSFHSPTPNFEPETPLRDSEHFEASPDVSPAMDTDAPDNEEVDNSDRIPDLASPGNDDDKMDSGADDMVQVLISLDVKHCSEVCQCCKK